MVKLGRYELEQKLGDGPTGTVHLASLSTPLGTQRYAVRSFHKRLVASPMVSSELARVARTYSRLRNDSIATLREFGVSEGNPFAAVQFIRGADLERVYSHGGITNRTVSSAQAVTLLKRVAFAIQMAHKKEVLHLGLSPRNVLFHPDKGIFVTDFGFLDACLKHNPRDDQLLAQVVSYLAPEQLKNRPRTAQTDVFQLGCLAHFLLTGADAFTGDTPGDVAEKIQKGELPQTGRWRSVDELLRHSLASDPLDRPKDAEKFLALVKQVEREIPPDTSLKTASTLAKELFEQDPFESHREETIVENISSIPDPETSGGDSDRYSTEIAASRVPIEEDEDEDEFDMEKTQVSKLPKKFRLDSQSDSKGEDDDLPAPAPVSDPPAPKKKQPTTMMLGSMQGEAPKTKTAPPKSMDHSGEPTMVLDDSAFEVMDADKAPENHLGTAQPLDLSALPDSEIPAMQKKGASPVFRKGNVSGQKNAEKSSEKPSAQAPPALPTSSGVRNDSTSLHRGAFILSTFACAAMGIGGYHFWKKSSEKGTVSVKKSVPVNIKAPLPLPPTPTLVADAAPDRASSPADAKLDDAPPDAPADAAPFLDAPSADAPIPDAPAPPKEPIRGTGETFALKVTSSPKRATVYVNGSKQGKTPLTIDVKDQYVVAILKDGYSMERREIQATGNTLDVELKKARRFAGSAGIKVRCKKKNRYYVVLDGEGTGQFCPTERLGTTKGAHKLEIYDPLTDSFSVKEIDIKQTKRSKRVYLD